MNLQPVTGAPFTAECIVCHKRKCFGGNPDIPFSRPNSGGFADLDGEPFKAYYCADHVEHTIDGFKLKTVPLCDYVFPSGDRCILDADHVEREGERSHMVNSKVASDHD